MTASYVNAVYLCITSYHAEVYTALTYITDTHINIGVLHSVFSIITKEVRLRDIGVGFQL